jgi:topoisomerase IA-like protein
VDDARKQKIVEEEDVEEAVEIIEEQREAKKRKEEAKGDTVKVGKFEIKKGPYGFYFTFNKQNYGIGQRDPATLTEQDCRDIMDNKKKWQQKADKEKKPSPSGKTGSGLGSIVQSEEGGSEPKENKKPRGRPAKQK